MVLRRDATALAASPTCVAASALLHAVSSVFHSLLSTVSTQLSPSCGGGRLAPHRPAVPAHQPAVPAHQRGRPKPRPSSPLPALHRTETQVGFKCWLASRSSIHYHQSVACRCGNGLKLSHNCCSVACMLTCEYFLNIS